MDAALLGFRNASGSICRHRAISGGVSALPSVCTSSLVVSCALAGRISMRNLNFKKVSYISGRDIDGLVSKRDPTVTRSSSSSNSNNETENSSNQEKGSFGNSRKDVLLIGLGVTVFGFGLESGLEYVGVDPLQAGNVVQLVLVLGLTIGWISTYIFRVSNKEMTYAQQLRDYEKKVMEKRLESLSEAELAALLEQVEEEKRQIASGEQVN